MYIYIYTLYLCIAQSDWPGTMHMDMVLFFKMVCCQSGKNTLHVLCTLILAQWTKLGYASNFMEILPVFLSFLNALLIWGSWETLNLVKKKNFGKSVLVHEVFYWINLSKKCILMLLHTSQGSLLAIFAFLLDLV